MFINNLKEIDIQEESIYSCDIILGKYLQKNGMPVLYKDEKKMYFSNVPRLNSVLNNLPLRFKFLIKIGVIDG